jgi:hypothetical protein
MELFLDFGTLGPFPEMVFEIFFRIGALEAKPFPLDVEALGLEIVAAEARDIGAKLAQARPFDLRVGFSGNEGLSGGGIMNGNPLGQFLIELIGEGLVAESGFVAEAGDEGKGVLTDLPFAVTAILPFSKVGGRDGPSVELSLENRLDGWF